MANIIHLSLSKAHWRHDERGRFGKAAEPRGLDALMGERIGHIKGPDRAAPQGHQVASNA
jgi:hypothetical protein